MAGRTGGGNLRRPWTAEGGGTIHGRPRGDVARAGRSPRGIADWGGGGGLDDGRVQGRYTS